MKAYAVILAAMAISFSIIASTACSSTVPTLGVKEGDWIQYSVNITGNPPAVHRNVTWMRLEVLQVKGAAFPANVTVGYANGTVESKIWRFNFTGGNTEGWIIIPSNLSTGDTFFDNYSKADKNIAIQSQEQKTVLGATRTVTFANDSYREKQWDKATGVFVGSSETFANWSSHVTAVDTNIWSPQILGLDQDMLYLAVGVAAVLVALTVSFLVLLARKKKPILQ